MCYVSAGKIAVLFYLRGYFFAEMLHLKRGTDEYRYIEGTSSASMDCSKDFEETMVSVFMTKPRMRSEIR